MAKTPEDFVRETIGKKYDIDKAYGVQCVDGFRKFCIWAFGYSWPTGTGRADGYWTNRYKTKAAEYFDFIPKGQEQSGDWCFWEYKKSCYPLSHVAMCYVKDGVKYMYGQNQSGSHSGFSLKKAKDWNILGAFRWKGWAKKLMALKTGYNIVTINGHGYYIYKQMDNELPAVLAVGSGKLSDFKKFDSGRNLVRYAMIGNANFFQMASGQSDPYGTTYGDLSSPFKDVYQIVPNQKSTLYFDLETGEYGNVNNYWPDKTHNVFSPGVVFSTSGTLVAPMLASNYINTASMFTGLLKCTDGKYAFVLTKTNTAPKTMWNDLKNYGTVLATLDGGGSAQMAAWTGSTYSYIRYTGRAIASVLIFYKKQATTTNTTPAKPVDTTDTTLKAENEKLKSENEKYKTAIKKIKEVLEGM